MKNLLLLLFLLFVTTDVSAQVISVSLSKEDHFQLTKVMANLPPQYRSEELIDPTPLPWYVLRKYSFLSKKNAFNIQCSEKFFAGSTVGAEPTCSVEFNYKHSDSSNIISHDGFIPAFAIAEIKNDLIARDLSSALTTGMASPAVFRSREQVVLAHPTTNQKFSAFRLRIDCKSEAQLENYSCVVSAVK